MFMTKLRTVSDKSAYPDSMPETKQKFRFFSILTGTAFVFYLFCVLYLTLGERLIYGSNSYFHKVTADVPYWTQVRKHIQPIPFSMILCYARRLPASNPLRRLAFVNLAGNLVLFFPMGIFLPVLMPEQRKFFRFSVTVILMILCIEITQVLSLLGTCDIDDLILNYTGAVCGFLCFQIFDFIRRKFHAGKNTRY